MSSDLAQLPIVPNTFEQFQRFSQPILRGILPQDHIITRARCHENDCSDIVKTLDPLAPFVPLTADVEHAEIGEPRV